VCLVAGKIQLSDSFKFLMRVIDHDFDNPFLYDTPIVALQGLLRRGSNFEGSTLGMISAMKLLTIQGMTISADNWAICGGPCAIPVGGSILPRYVPLTYLYSEPCQFV
jgi:hypothetical protein